MARDQDVFVRAANFIYVSDEDFVLTSAAKAVFVEKFIADRLARCLLRTSSSEPLRFPERPFR